MGEQCGSIWLIQACLVDRIINKPCNKVQYLAGRNMSGWRRVGRDCVTLQRNWLRRHMVFLLYQSSLMYIIFSWSGPAPLFIKESTDVGQGSLTTDHAQWWLWLWSLVNSSWPGPSPEHHHLLGRHFLRIASGKSFYIGKAKKRNIN